MKEIFVVDFKIYVTVITKNSISRSFQTQIVFNSGLSLLRADGVWSICRYPDERLPMLDGKIREALYHPKDFFEILGILESSEQETILFNIDIFSTL